MLDVFWMVLLSWAIVFLVVMSGALSAVYMKEKNQGVMGRKSD